MTEWYPTLQLRWARRSTSRMAVLQQQFFNGMDYEWKDVPVVGEDQPVKEKMTKAREIAEEAVMLLRKNGMSSNDIEIAVQKLDLMIERAIHDDVKALIQPTAT